MKLPSDAQAAVLACVQDHEARREQVLFGEGKRSRGNLLIEVEVDRTREQAMVARTDDRLPALIPADLETPLNATVHACVRHGWVDMNHEVRVTTSRYGRCWSAPSEYVLRHVDLEEDGVIALGRWRHRQLAGGPVPLPTLSEREREVAELAARALELGYALCPREPARAEARRMRSAGWFERDGCWVANNAQGLVPTPLAVVEIRPDQADQPEEMTA
jgi:hypothetical protein